MSDINTANEKLQDGVNRCPACGSTDIQLRAQSGMLMCLFCRHEWAEQTLESLLGEDPDLTTLTGVNVASGATDIDPEAAGVLTLKCGGCGAEVVVNLEESVASRCHWCRHTLTVNEQVPNGVVPDAVLPFTVTHEQAVTFITQFADKRKTFAHPKFKEGFSPENVLGVYLPYMVVDANASAQLIGEGEITTRTYKASDNDDPDLYDADVYSLHRHLDFTVDDLIIESSSERSNMQAMVNTNNIINAVLPFDTKSAVQWNANYLSGFTSEKRDQDVEDIQPQLENQLLSIARSQVQPTTTKYGRGVRWDQEGLDTHGTKWVAMYLPVWLYSYYHESRGKAMVHYIAVNGRSGKTMGSIPVSHPRIMVASAVTAVAAEIAAVVAYVVGG